MNANLANMYAAYYPYYMNHQFPPGASPFGNTAPAAPGYGQPFGAPPAVAPVPAAKYPYQGGAPTGAPQQQGQVQGQQQQPGANKPPATASTAGIYGGYNAYGGAPAAADDSQDAYGKYQPFLQGSGAGGQKVCFSNESMNEHRTHNYTHAYTLL